MNEPMDVLQDKLTQIEAGASLEENLSGSTIEETDLLLLAVALREMPLEERDEVQVQTQREQILAAAAQTLGNHKPQQDLEKLSSWAQLRLWWANGGRQWQWGAGIAAMLLLILLGGLWLNKNLGEETKLTASLPPEDKVLPATGAGSASEKIEEDSPAEAAAPVPLPAYELYVPAVTSSLSMNPQQAALEEIKGLVEVMDADGLWTAVRQPRLVQAGQRIRTGNLSSVRLTFNDGSQAILGPETELSLEQLNALSPEAGFRTVVLTQLLGETWHAVQFRHDGGSLYEVKTPTGSGVARGTQFQVIVRPDETASYTVTEGKVDVTNAGRMVPVIAGQRTQFDADEPPAPPDFLVTGEGIVTQIGPTWVIAEQVFVVDDNSLIVGDPQIGDLVSVEGRLLPDGRLAADLIRLLQAAPTNEFVLIGPVEAVSGEQWTVAGQEIWLTEETAVEPEISLGDTVQVNGTIRETDGALVANKIVRLVVDQPRPFEFTGVVQTVGAAAWTISGVSLTVDGETEIAAGITVGSVVHVEGWIDADSVWHAQEIKLSQAESPAFSLTGPLTSQTPWTVAGVSFEVRDWSVIDPAVEVGSIVRVEGIILEDGTWVARTIETLDESLLQLVFVGVVETTDSWVISGLPISVDEHTVLDEGIVPGDLVRVTVQIQLDGTWQAMQIERLPADVPEGCLVVTAVITSAGPDQINTSSGQSYAIPPEAVIEGELAANNVVAIVVCLNEDGLPEVISITVIYEPAALPPPSVTPPPPDETDTGSVTICHKPGTPAQKTMTLPRSALNGHLGHGDTLGPCP